MAISKLASSFMLVKAICISAHVCRAGPNMSSMLAQRVASNKLADSFMAFNTNYQDAGLFGVYAVCSEPSTIDDLVRDFRVLRVFTGSLHRPLHHRPGAPTSCTQLDTKAQRGDRCCRSAHHPRWPLLVATGPGLYFSRVRYLQEILFEGWALCRSSYSCR